MKKLQVLIGIIIAGVGLTGCGKSYLDINTPNPNAATSATPELVITNAMTVTASFQVAASTLTPANYLNAWMGYWAQSGSYATSNTDMSSYNQTTNYANTLWITEYRNLEDYYYVEQSAQTQNKPYYGAMAKTMKSIVFGELVDFFNDVPYTQAFQGTKVITPTYDKGQAIYESLAGQLDSAVLMMNSPAAVAADNTDIMFYGDNASWIAFANTVKLRLLMRQTQMSGRDAYINGEIGKIVANGGGFLDVDAAVSPGPDASTPGYANNDGQQNPIWGFFVTLTGNATSGGGADLYRANDYAISVLNAYNDPRLGLIYDVNNANSYVGSVLGGQFNPPGGGTSPAVGPGILKSVSQPSVILSAAESHFLQAEAIVRGYLTGDAKAEYEAGVQASFDFLGAGSATAYLSFRKSRHNLVDSSRSSGANRPDHRTKMDCHGWRNAKRSVCRLSQTAYTEHSAFNIPLPGAGCEDTDTVFISRF